MQPVPHVDVRAQYAPLIPELKEAFASFLDGDRYILGKNVRAFEEEAAAYLGVPRTIGVGNGTDAIVIVLNALGVGPGDEVICPSFTFYATAEAIAVRGATPVFADIDPHTLNLDPERVGDKVSPRTKAILPVHLFGRPMPLDGLTELGVPVIEDAAQAFGAPGVATTGVASTFSFFPTKNLFTLGDGGLVAVSEPELGERIKMLRFHGSRDKQRFELVGYNSRLDEVHAAMLRIFLRRLDEWTRLRREAAARYAELGLGALVDLPEDEPGHVYHMYCVRSPERDAIREVFRRRDIGHAAYYTTPLHRQPALAGFGAADDDLPETGRAAAENLCLPLWAGISADQQEQVVDAVRAAVGARVAS